VRDYPLRGMERCQQARMLRLSQQVNVQLQPTPFDIGAREDTLAFQ
jgi:hypothetical protein